MSEKRLYEVYLSDNSILLVDSSFNLLLFDKNNIEKHININLEKYLKHKFKYRNYLLCDYIDNKYKKLNFKIIQSNNKYNLPLGTRYKLSQNIHVGDKLIGPDGEVREVKKLHTGKDQLYTLKTESGEVYKVNSKHILTLVSRINDEVINIPLDVYLLMDDNFKQEFALLKV